MRKNPDRICWKCGQLIEDRTYRSACYCTICYSMHRREYQRNIMRNRTQRIERSGLETIAIDLLDSDYEQYLEERKNEFGII